MKHLPGICVTILLTVAAPSAQALVNGGFETGDLTGWTWNPPPGGGGFAGAVTSHTDISGPPWTSPPLVFPVSNPPGETDWVASSGNYFGLLKTNGPGSTAYLYQSFTVLAGATLTFDYFWDSQDYVSIYPCFDDNAEGAILQGAGLAGAVETILFTESVFNDMTLHGSNYWGTPWTQVSYTFPTGGTYTLVIHIQNVCDSILDSHVGIDGVEVKAIEVDIKPGSYPSSINLKSKGVTPVAIHTTEYFDATTVDPETVELMGIEAVKWEIYDCDEVWDSILGEMIGDGDLDLVLYFETQALSGVLSPGDTEAMLTGQTFGGANIEGIGDVSIVK